MGGSSPAEAIEQLFDPLQRAISCVTESVLTGRRYTPSDVPHVVSFHPAEESAALGRTSNLRLSFRHFYRLERGETGDHEPWNARSAGYIYELIDTSGNRIVAYHWHPIEGGPVGHEHMHIGRRLAHSGLPEEIRWWAERLVRGHLPTERVSLESVLKLAIAEFEVEPLRDDWQSVFDKTERSFNR